MSDKEMVIEAIRRLPEDTTLEEICEDVALLAALQKAKADSAMGRVVPHNLVRQRLAAEWITE